MNRFSDQGRRSAGTLARLKGAASLLVLAASAVAGPAWAQQADAQQTPPAPPQAPAPETVPGAADFSADTIERVVEEEAAEEGQEIVVTGFRGSLNAALDVKRESVSTVDAIVAEDIAKFPDQNLAEALQRIPGISIQRDGGEGRSITVRGLGAQFTRVRVNGMETVATSTDGASANRDRAFDFNVFASELFTSIVVHKTAEASLDEGSLGAVVDLNTGNPLGNKRGLTLAINAQATYNDLSDNFGPRLSGLIGWKNDAGTFAAQASIAYQRTDTLELGNNTVRWEQARFDSVNGTPCWYNGEGAPSPNSGGTFNPNAAGGACGDVGLAFHPRIPRYGEVSHDRKRLGLTTSIQFEPNDRTRVSIDGLYSDFKEDREEKWGEVLFRSNERRIDVVDYEIDDDNNLISGTFDNAWVRTEHYLRKSETKFWQIGSSWDQDITDKFRFTLLGGLSKSNADIPLETTMIFDNRNAQDYHYDYTDMWNPVLTFGTSMTDPANFQLAEIRDRPSNVTNKFRTAQLRTEWDVTEAIQLKAGAVYRRFDFDAEAFTRDTAVCGASGPDLVLGGPANGGVTCSSAVYGFPVTPELADLFKLGDAGQPSGTTEEWLIPNLDATTDFTGLYDRNPVVDAGNTRSVTERVTGGYFQIDAKGELAGLEYAFNLGTRYVRTKQTSTGLLSGVEVTVDRTYDDWLPAFNLALYPTRNIIIRAAAGKVLTRPTLGQLSPGGSADGFNFRITNGNPELEPYRATDYDLGFEWYFAKESIFSVAFFLKDIASFPVSETITGVSFNDTGLPVSVLVPSSPAALDPALRAAPIWTINTTVNGEGAKLKGVEIGLQGPFRFLPGFLSNFGGIVNVTLVDSNATYTVTGPRVAYLANGNYAAVVPEDRKSTFFGLSKRAFNGTLYYDDGKLSIRGSASYRSGFNDQNSGTGNVFEGYKSTINVDAAIRYQINDRFQLSLDGINLTDEYRDRWTDIDAKRNYEHNHFGRTFVAGVSYRL
jgi:iron complex outermembrane receptor protein